MMRVLAALSTLALLLPAPVWAQAGNPAGMAPGTPQVAPGTPAPHVPNQADQLFARQAAIGGMAEVELAKLVEKRSHNADLEAFAKRMVEEHGKVNERLKALAEAAGIALPGGLDPEHQAVLERLRKLEGAEFDRAYIASQVADHQKTVQLLEWEIGSGQDPALKSFASETLPVVLDHLAMAQRLQAELAAS